MTPSLIIERAAAEGVRLAVTPAGTIKAIGDEAAVSRWLPTIRQYKPDIVALLKDATNDPLATPDQFDFNPPGNPANDDEALQERVAIMMEGNGWDEAKALQAAREEADKERCWRGFLNNAKRVLDAPKAKRDGLLAQYRMEAIRRYGIQTGKIMAEGLRDWVGSRAVH